MKVPGCAEYLITSFFPPPAAPAGHHAGAARSCARRSWGRGPEPGEHLLVYQTAEGGPTCPRPLGPSGVECRVYGVRRDLTEDQVEGGLRYRPFSEEGFIDDLRTARGVVDRRAASR